MLFLQKFFHPLRQYMNWLQFFTSSVGKKIVMALTGLFLIVHLADFWVPSRFGGLEPAFYANSPNREYHDLYGKMIEVFQNPWIVVLYVIGCISLAWHLVHGFQASFRSLGLYNTKYIALINAVGIVFAIIVPLLFAAMPISIYLG